MSTIYEHALSEMETDYQELSKRTFEKVSVRVGCWKIRNNRSFI
jgi:hypothetical protein